MDELRFGLIGCGDIGNLRAEALSGVEGLQLMVVSDLVSERANRLARLYEAQMAEDWRDILTRDDIDVVMVSTPPSLHGEMGRAALEAGKHVLVEKPLTHSVEEAESLVQTAAQTKRVLATGFNFRFYPPVVKARSLIQRGLIGDIDHVRGYIGYSGGELSQEWMRDSEISGAGTLHDNGIHLIDLAGYFMGPLKEVKGFVTNGVWNYQGCEDNGFILFRDQNNAVASLQTSWTEWRGYRMSLEVYGSRGCISLKCFPMWLDVVWQDQGSGKQRRMRDLFLFDNLMEHLRSYRWVVVNSLTKELLALSRAIRGEVSSLATGEDGLLAVSISSAVLESSRTGNTRYFAG